MSDGSAYRSRLTLECGPFPDATTDGLGEVTDADDERLREMKRTVAEPVVVSLLADELTSLVLCRIVGRPSEVHVRVAAAGEVFEDLMFSPFWHVEKPDGEGGLTGARLSARHLADSLEDWIAESGFGWGQQRTARYVLPPS